MKNFLNIYTTPLLISFTLAIALIALPVIKNPFEIVLVFVFSLLGTFILDLDYIIHPYIIEPESAFSKNLKAFIKHKDYFGVIKYSYTHEEEMKDKTLHSAIFQIFFALFSIFVIYSDVYYPIKVLVMSILANTIYKVIKIYLTKNLNDWFWSFKTVPDKRGFFVYLSTILLIFGYCIYVI